MKRRPALPLRPPADPFFDHYVVMSVLPSLCPCHGQVHWHSMIRVYL